VVLVLVLWLEVYFKIIPMKLIYMLDTLQEMARQGQEAKANELFNTGEKKSIGEKIMYIVL
jgi:hypothetical protein